MLLQQSAEDLNSIREPLQKMAGASTVDGIGQSAIAALIKADGSIDLAWTAAKGSPAALVRLLTALSLVADAKLRHSAYAPVLELLNQPSADADGASVRRAAILALPGLSEEPGAVFAALAHLIEQDKEIPTAARAISKLPASAWSKNQAVIDHIIGWAQAVPVARRRSSEYTETFKVAQQFIALLSGADAEAATQALASLDVKTFTIKAVREQLRYDTVRLVVEAGKPFEVIFENPDAMPHNLVFVQPGTLQEVATSVQTQGPDKLDSKGRAYVPDNDLRVLEATKLVEAGKSETLKMIAPSVEGAYPFVCTFPGHWAVMKGELIATKNVKAYQEAHPQK
jgi:azurin